MYTYIEETETNTVLYRVGPYQWSFTLVLFYLTELFELTFIPKVYRKIFHKGDKPTLMQWLARYPRLWSTKTIYSAGTKIKVSKANVSVATIADLFGKV